MTHKKAALSPWLKACLFVVSLVQFSCIGDTEPNPEKGIRFEQPPHFPEATYTFENNPVTKEGFELGRKLFFDPLLSRDGSVSCASCHVQAVAFADPQHRLSVGIEEREGTRNAPGIFNLAFRSSFFWDGGVTHLDFVPVTAIENPVEMDDKLSNVVSRLNDHPDYPLLFKAAFGNEEVTSIQMLHALSQFMALMVSDNSRYDDYLNNKERLQEDELTGLALFEQHCAACHSGVLFTDESFRNNGLDTGPFADPGRARISEVPADSGKFLVPSLRNVAITRPYMHDGRFKTLEEVLRHYAEGVKQSSSLDALLLKNEEPGIPLSEEEQQAIIAFLETLTDRKFIADPRFREP